MRIGSSILTPALLILWLCVPALAQQDQTAPPLVKQLNNGNWLPQKEAEDLRDELYYQRAVHAYMTMLPALNTIGMKDGSEAAFGDWRRLMMISGSRQVSTSIDCILSDAVSEEGSTPPHLISTKTLAAGRQENSLEFEGRPVPHALLGP